MIKKLSFGIAAILLLVLQSCSVNTETSYFKDSATSMEFKILMDKNMFGVINLLTSGADETSKNPSVKDFQNLSTEWKSLYDIQKTGKLVLNDKDAAPLKKMYLKINKDKGEILGLSLKYDKLLPAEIASIFLSNRQLKNIPLQDFGKWDGNRLEIDTEKFNVAESLQEIQKIKPENKTAKPKSKSDSIEVYGRQMASGMMGMLKMFNGDFTNTLKFQKPIKSIQGKHDFVKQIDSKTIQINVHTANFWEEGKNLKNKDKKIIIITE